MFSSNIKGFAIKTAENPIIETIDTGVFTITDPSSEMEYYWYEDSACGIPLHSGNSFSPEEDGTYYVSAYIAPTITDPIDPTTVDGMIIRMDASDINGDGVLDEAIPNGEGYDWLFTPDNGMTDRGWFAYRSNYQNGLGIADFGTIWYQEIDDPIGGYQTIILAYQENNISFPETAPFQALSNDIPKHEDGSQFYSDSAPPRTKNGVTYLNGEIIDPFNAPNDMEFNILVTAMSDPSPFEVRNTDTHWEGKIGELLLFDRALSESEIKGISSYLNKKWVSLGSLESDRTSFNWSSSVATIDSENEANLQIFPNPSNDYIFIDNVQEGSLLKILTSQGEQCYSSELKDTKSKIDVSSLIPGFYFIQVYNVKSKKLSVHQFVKI